MLAIDRHAWTNRWHDLHPLEKLLPALGMLLVTLVLPPWPTAPLSIAAMLALTILGAGVPAGAVLGTLAVPLGFLLTGAPVLAWGARLPPSHESLPTTVEFTASARGERWARRFGRHPMGSRLWFHQGRLREQLGAVRFEFALDERDGAIHWQARRAWLFGVLPLPSGWFASVRCREYAVAGRYTFEVDVSLPWVGPFIHYEGQLEPA